MKHVIWAGKNDVVSRDGVTAKALGASLLWLQRRPQALPPRAASCLSRYALVSIARTHAHWFSTAVFSSNGSSPGARAAVVTHLIGAAVRHTRIRRQARDGFLSPVLVLFLNRDCTDIY